MASGEPSLVNMTVGRGVFCVAIARCSSTSRLGDSVSITTTSGSSSSTVFSSVSGDERVAVTSCPARSNPSRRRSARSGDSSTTRTRITRASQGTCHVLILNKQWDQYDNGTTLGQPLAVMHNLAAMRDAQPKEIRLQDYTPPAFGVASVELDVDIREDHALVRAKLAMRRNATGPLVLDGDELD